MSDADLDVQAVDRADLTGTVCPMTQVKFRMRIARIADGEVLQVVVKAGDQMRDLPKTIKDEGHRIVAVRQEGDLYHLLVRKGQ